jgi:hypothetical protein
MIGASDSVAAFEFMHLAMLMLGATKAILIAVANMVLLWMIICVLNDGLIFNV